MGNLTDWIQNHWFELGSLLLQLATLATLTWFGRKALAILTASPRHSEIPQPIDAELAPPEPSRPYQGALRGLVPVEPQAAYAPAPAPASHVASAAADPWRAMLIWLNTPMRSGTAIPWRRITRQLS